MGSATRTALAAATKTLAAQQGVTLATGEQLLGAARAIAGSTQLRSLLADPALPGSEKSTLVGSIFRSMDPAAATLLNAAAEARWSDADDLVDGVEQLGIRAIARAAGPDAPLESELFAFGRAVASNPQLELAVGSKLGDPDEKSALVERLIGGTASAGAVVILRHLVQSARGRRIGELVSLAARSVADANDRIVARVTAASPLTPAQLTQLSGTIQKQYGREPRIDVVIDPSVLGGVRVQVGDEVVDGTIAARLADLRLQLAG